MPRSVFPGHLVDIPSRVAYHLGMGMTYIYNHLPPIGSNCQGTCNDGAFYLICVGSRYTRGVGFASPFLALVTSYNVDPFVTLVFQPLIKGQVVIGLLVSECGGPFQ